MPKKKSARKPSVKVNDLANKNDPSGGTVKLKSTTSTNDKVDTYLENKSSLKTNTPIAGWDVKTNKSV